MPANRLLLALATFCCLGTAAGAEEDCKLHRAASLDMQIDERGRATVPVSIGGHDFRMMIGTGGAFSRIKPSVAEKLKLELAPLPAELRHSVMLYGDEFINQHVEAKDIVIGHLPVIPHKDFVVEPENHMPPELAGLIAQDMLRFFDIDFDFANEKFSIFLPDHCPGQVVYWADDGEYAVIPMNVNAAWNIRVPVELDGHRVTATLDTGASRSVFSWDYAQEIFGLNEKSPGVKPANGMHGYQYPFKTLTMKGDEGVAVTVQNPDILLVPDKVSGMGRGGHADIVLGMGILRQLHLYVAYKEWKLYATPASLHH